MPGEAATKLVMQQAQALEARQVFSFHDSCAQQICLSACLLLLPLQNHSSAAWATGRGCDGAEAGCQGTDRPGNRAARQQEACQTQPRA